MDCLKISTLFAAGVLATATGAQAQDANRWFVKGGPAIIALDENAKMYAAGNLVPGANVTIKPQGTIELEGGYFVTKNVAVALTVGVPPLAKVEGAGTIAPLGTLGKAIYGPGTLTAEYHFNRDGKFQPYVGAGMAFLLIFHAEDGAISDLKATNDLGGALQAGADYMFTPRTGVYVDFKQTYLSTKTTGFLGPAPVVGQVRLNPAAYSVGFIRRF